MSFYKQGNRNDPLEEGGKEFKPAFNCKKLFSIFRPFIQKTLLSKHWTWEISGWSTETNSRNTTKMVEHKLVLFATVIALWTLVTLNNEANSHTPIVETHTIPKLSHLGCHMGKFSSRLVLGNRSNPASHMNTLIFLQRKQWRGEISENEPARMTGLN